MFLAVYITKPCQTVLQIFGCNTIKAVHPFLQAAVVAVYVLDMVHTFDTLFFVGLESVMSQAL